MTQIFANDLIRLTINVPELALAIGEVGRVVSAWFFPNQAYEVEFAARPAVCTRRVLLMREQIALAAQRRRGEHCA